MMKHINTFENWFTNIFKSKEDESDYWSYSINKLEEQHGFNMIMQAAVSGNLKKFKYFLPNYIDKINDVCDEYNLPGENVKFNVLMYVIVGNGDLPDKKSMITLLIDNGIDTTYMSNEYSFYDLIKNESLKKWIDYTYPEIVEELNIIKKQKLYNI